MVIVVKRYCFRSYPTVQDYRPSHSETDTVAINPPEAVPGSTWVQWGQPAFDEHGATVGWLLREDEPEGCSSVSRGNWGFAMHCLLGKGHDGKHSAMGYSWPREDPEVPPASRLEEICKREEAWRRSDVEQCFHSVQLVGPDTRLRCKLPKGHAGLHSCPTAHFRAEW